MAIDRACRCDGWSGAARVKKNKNSRRHGVLYRTSGIEWGLSPGHNHRASHPQLFIHLLHTIELRFSIYSVVLSLH
jgi:hypothetical protein